MEHVNFIRHLDDIGRIHIPREVRRVININPGDAMEMQIDGDTILIRRWDAAKKAEEAAKALVNILVGAEGIEECSELLGAIEKIRELAKAGRLSV
jgi:transcriptional pleiotropic regulator of transition state genes